MEPEQTSALSLIIAIGRVLFRLHVQIADSLDMVADTAEEGLDMQMLAVRAVLGSKLVPAGPVGILAAPVLVVVEHTLVVWLGQRWLGGLGSGL